jgi:hypothetical protein
MMGSRRLPSEVTPQADNHLGHSRGVQPAAGDHRPGWDGILHMNSDGTGGWGAI